MVFPDRRAGFVRHSPTCPELSAVPSVSQGHSVQNGTSRSSMVPCRGICEADARRSTSAARRHWQMSRQWHTALVKLSRHRAIEEEEEKPRQRKSGEKRLEDGGPRRSTEAAVVRRRLAGATARSNPRQPSFSRHPMTVSSSSAELRRDAENRITISSRAFRRRTSAINCLTIPAAFGLRSSRQAEKRARFSSVNGSLATARFFVSCSCRAPPVGAPGRASATVPVQPHVMQLQSASSANSESSAT